MLLKTLQSILLTIILNYPTAKRLSKARVATLSSIPYLNEQKAISLINKARVSVAASDDDVPANLIISLVKQIIELRQPIARLVAQTAIVHNGPLSEV